MHAALWGAAKGIVCTLHVDHKPRFTLAQRIECMPVEGLGMLAKIGVDISKLHVDVVFTKRRIAWGTNFPVDIQSKPYVTIERPTLEQTLFQIACSNYLIKINTSNNYSIDEVVDASGFNPMNKAIALTWVAKVFCLKNLAGRDRIFSLASLPNGYVYRASSLNWTNLAFVGPVEEFTGEPSILEDAIHCAGQGWILDGLPPLSYWGTTRGGMASFDTSSSLSRKIGGSAFRRDILSSQGVISGLSDGYHAVQCVENNDWSSLTQRHLIERTQHLRSLCHMLRSNRFCMSSEWRNYEEWLNECAEKLKTVD